MAVVLKVFFNCFFSSSKCWRINAEGKGESFNVVWELTVAREYVNTGFERDGGGPASSAPLRWPRARSSTASHSAIE
ncbi:hypothetical protein AAFF_G00039130 [Aldrovandia affinis]|uniref:Uncharacterized protein n=1 Tax=Aldrovandia affinis TaxID=143900 RepID=A0AAD7T702_9TELE|nr:hypothetical protein AAFF_G00039130 [Aldrovandia affinis]